MTRLLPLLLLPASCERGWSARAEVVETAELVTVCPAYEHAAVVAQVDTVSGATWITASTAARPVGMSST